MNLYYTEFDQFQFHLVRLKEFRISSVYNACHVSIPFSTIKRYRAKRFFFRLSVSIPFSTIKRAALPDYYKKKLVSIPFSTIKSAQKSRVDTEGFWFQFHLVRLKVFLFRTRKGDSGSFNSI